MEKLIATVHITQQVTHDQWRIHSYSRVFSTSRPIKDIFNWMENMGVKNPTTNDLELTDYTGESL